jgi:hypothetical protein
MLLENDFQRVLRDVQTDEERRVRLRCDELLRGGGPMSFEHFMGKHHSIIIVLQVLRDAIVFSQGAYLW